MFLNSRPVRFLVTRVARAYGFLDPVAVMANLRKFARPSEVAEPIELLRAGMLFHARGLVNTKAIQHNLDWVWPFWVEKQFNPADPSFIPRAFSFSHINITHRDWTAVGVPDVPFYPIVDPRGLVTPFFDGWSIDFWYISPAFAEASAGKPDFMAVFPSKLEDFSQSLALDDTLRVRSSAAAEGIVLKTDVRLCLEGSEAHCCITASVRGGSQGALVVALRPFNPEGVSFIESIRTAPDGLGWLVNGGHPVTFGRAPERQVFSNYENGDVSLQLNSELPKARGASAPSSIRCSAGMATAAAIFAVGDSGETAVEVRAPIYDELDSKRRPSFGHTESWAEAIAPLARLECADSRLKVLYDQALASTVLHAPGEVFPGPYTYKRFWFRDAAFILNALISVGAKRRVRRALAEFSPRQRRDGYFLSQEGEWDSNGEALWFYNRYARLTGEALPDSWLDSVKRGARWIHRKRLPLTPARPEAGLLPAGFSAEHLGPNDFYYWDDFWAVAGLRGAASLLCESDPAFAGECGREADEFLALIRRSFPMTPGRRFPGAIPASPLRRMDSGAIGSIVADYPLQLFAPNDSWVVATADYLRDHSSVRGGFFQNMIHSGINAYLTLHLAQVRLRAGDPEAAWALMDTVTDLASPTGQWPEANHPQTGGGCMGDGQHIWAAAEWLMMVRNCFVREEAGSLVIGAGVRPSWWRNFTGVTFGPTLTPHGPVTVRLQPTRDSIEVTVDGDWRDGPPPLQLCVPGCARRIVNSEPAESSPLILEKIA